MSEISAKNLSARTGLEQARSESLLKIAQEIRSERESQASASRGDLDDFSDFVLEAGKKGLMMSKSEERKAKERGMEEALDAIDRMGASGSPAQKRAAALLSGMLAQSEHHFEDALERIGIKAAQGDLMRSAKRIAKSLMAPPEYFGLASKSAPSQSFSEAERFETLSPAQQKLVQWRFEAEEFLAQKAKEKWGDAKDISIGGDSAADLAREIEVLEILGKAVERAPVGDISKSLVGKGIEERVASLSDQSLEKRLGQFRARSLEPGEPSIGGPRGQTW